jgi:hypothetical protein
MSNYVDNGKVFTVDEDCKYLGVMGMKVGDTYILRKSNKRAYIDVINQGFEQMEQSLILNDGSEFKFKRKLEYSRSSMKGFYVYAAVRSGEVVYVGKGSKKRWEHCVNGTSETRELNELAILHGDTQVYLLCEHLGEGVALDIENMRIRDLKPKFNKRGYSRLPRCRDCYEVVITKYLVGTEQDAFYYDGVCPCCTSKDDTFDASFSDKEDDVQVCLVSPKRFRKTSGSGYSPSTITYKETI